jgi:hypothetical protein
MPEPEEPRVSTKYAELSLSDIAALMPGTGQVMSHVSHLWGTCWYAAHGGNWDLASFYFRRTRSELRALIVTRPKYSEQLRRFEAGSLEPVGHALVEKDLAGFKEAFEDAVDHANAFHAETGYRYIRWRLPDRSPEAGLDLGPPPAKDES